MGEAVPAAGSCGAPGLLVPAAKLRKAKPNETVQKVIALRRRRFIGKHIAAETGASPSTVSRILKRAGQSRLKDLEPEEPVRRYERARPGEIIHIDIKKLGRFAVPGHRATGTRQNCRNKGAGWDFVHVAIDDHSRVAFSQIRPDEKAVSAVALLKAAAAYYTSLGVVMERVMTDNGSCYKSRDFAAACRRLRIRHIRTKPHTPKTSGKAERCIQTALREWAYARTYEDSLERSSELPAWLHRYNWHRPDGSLNSKPPVRRLPSSQDNLLRFHS